MQQEKVNDPNIINGMILLKGEIVMVNIFKSAKFWIGVGGVAAGIFATSKCARKIAVKSMAAGMQTRDNIKAGWESIKEEAEDLYEEAKEEAAAKEAEVEAAQIEEA